MRVREEMATPIWNEAVAGRERAVRGGDFRMDMLPYRVLLALGDDLPADRLCGLLQAVDRLGSIRKAAAELSLSYRYAWGLVKEAEQRLGAPLLVRSIGGATGGGAELTEAARDLLTRYEQFRRHVEDEASRFFGTSEQPVTGSESMVQPVLLASTMEPVESGLLAALEEAFYAEVGIMVRHVAAGSGQALALAREGRVDLVLTHAPDLERRFVAEGWGEGRYPVMFNDFLLVGPAEDPAGIREAAGAVDAFRRIAACGAPFVSRGDRSGTHLRELALWRRAGISPASPWYQVCPQGHRGNQAVLRRAGEQGAYALVDRAAWLTAREAGLPLCPLREGDPLLRNEFSLVPVSPARHPWVHHEAARRFVEWAAGPAGQALIARYGCDRFGEPLFHPVRFR